MTTVRRGKIRWADQNVTFGVPKHRGVIGDKICKDAFEMLRQEIQTNFKEHDSR